MSDTLRLTQGGDGSKETSAGAVQTLQVDGLPVKLDALGPMVINTDGTVSRIANWAQLSDVERERTLRLIAKRNKQRIERLEAQSA